MFDDDRAIHDFSYAIHLDPNDSVAYEHRGYVRQHKHENAEAILDFTMSIRAKPNAASYCSRGDLFLENKAYDKAIADFDEAIHVNPNHPFAYRQSAWICATCPQVKFRDGKKAIKNATKACELTTWKQGYYLDVLAAAYAEAGDFDAAVKWEQKAIEAEPGGDSTYRGRLEAYKDHKPLRDE